MLAVGGIDVGNVRRRIGHRIEIEGQAHTAHREKLAEGPRFDPHLFARDLGDNLLLTAVVEAEIAVVMFFVIEVQKVTKLLGQLDVVRPHAVEGTNKDQRLDLVVATEAVVRGDRRLAAILLRETWSAVSDQKIPAVLFHDLGDLLLRDEGAEIAIVAVRASVARVNGEPLVRADALDLGSKIKL